MGIPNVLEIAEAQAFKLPLLIRQSRLIPCSKALSRQQLSNWLIPSESAARLIPINKTVEGRISHPVEAMTRHEDATVTEIGAGGRVFKWVVSKEGRLLGVPRLDATSASPDSPLHLDADAVYNGTAFNLIAGIWMLAQGIELRRTGKTLQQAHSPHQEKMAA